MKALRFSGDVAAERLILDDPTLSSLLKTVPREPSMRSPRTELLANAVRVNPRVLPEVDQAIESLRARANLDAKLECFVYQCPVIEACVFKTRSGFIVLLASATVEKLTAEELEFVLGHEFGHVIYGHFELPVPKLLHSNTSVTPKHAIRLLSWHRRAEISADRAGLLCCGSLEIAARAFFKVLSGLSIANLTVDPIQLAGQFDELREEIWRQGSDEMCLLPHPLSPLRMKSLLIFWHSDQASEFMPGAPGGRAIHACDREISDLLAYMDPIVDRADGDVDPLLLPFLTWGGLYIAAANRQIEQSELDALTTIIGEHHVAEALQESHEAADYRERFANALKQRRRPLSALDISRVFTCLISMARADGSIDPMEIDAMHDLARQLGVSNSYVDTLIAEV